MVVFSESMVGCLMSQPSSASREVSQSGRAENIFAVVLFVAALAFHGWGASVGWTNLNLPGCEFRQTQTAVSALFIQRENNFSLAYPTPVLGKPWSIPMEFPLYQWTVVVVSNVAGIPLTQAGRTVTLACFYLTLPALYFFLRRLGLSRSRSLIALGLVVVCPLYVFYARSFLIETMALMFGVWFLLGYVNAVEKRNLAWLGLGALAGAGCGLVKVTTCMFFLLPALLWTFWWFGRDWREGKGRRQYLVRAGWCLATVALPVAASIWWVHYSDRIKARSVAGAFLQSAGMTGYNFGVGVRWDPGIWKQHWIILSREIAPPLLLVLAGVMGLFFVRRWWGMIVALIGLFVVVQAVFPILYAWHEYYYVANAVMLMLAIGLVLCGLLESRLPGVAAFTVILVFYGIQVWTYLHYYYPTQRNWSPDGSDLAQVLRQVTGPDDVLVIAGDDWSSITPYFAQRRAFMIRRNLEKTWDIIAPAYRNLKDEPVSALILYGDQRHNEALIQMTVTAFNLDPRPVFTWRDATVYLHRVLRDDAIQYLSMARPAQIGLTPESLNGETSTLRREIEVGTHVSWFARRFSLMHPMPWKFYTTFGNGMLELDGMLGIGANPDTRLWFKAAAGRRHIAFQACLFSGAYDEKLTYYDRSDGAEIRVTAIEGDGARRQILSRLINPRDISKDRGVQQIDQEFELMTDGDVLVEVLPGPRGNYSRDWLDIGRLEIK
jgi:hypothetical protein